MQDPQPEFRPVAGVPEDMAPGVRRLLAPNPSPMTYRGTNTYLIGDSDLAIIDPGPDDAAHFQAILAAMEDGQTITHILVTHAHLDHSPLSKRLSQHFDAPVYGFGPAEAGRSAAMQALADSGCVGGGEGVDSEFNPDITLSDGDQVSGSGWSLTALHTPGHMANHLAFSLRDDLLFSGDLVMGWASSLVSPPDGDLGAFMASLRRLSKMNWSRFFPGHGAPVEDPQERIEFLLNHRLAREDGILKALHQGPASASMIAEIVYTDTPTALLPAASRNVLAHLIDLMEQSRVSPTGDLGEEAVFKLN